MKKQLALLATLSLSFSLIGCGPPRPAGAPPTKMDVAEEKLKEAGEKTKEAGEKAVEAVENAARPRKIRPRS